MSLDNRLLRVLTSILLAGLLLASPRVAGADDSPRPGTGSTDLSELSLDQLMNIEVESVYGASRYTQRSLDAPTRVTVLTAEDIGDHGYRTLGEALRAATGLFVSYDRIYEFLGMRGVGHVDDYNSRVLVLVDGHRTNDDLFEGALIGTDFALDMEQVDRIEVIRGPSSALYGSNAVQGVINIVTRQARQTTGLKVSANGGSLGTAGGRIAWGGRLGDHGTLQLSASGLTSDGNARLYFPAFDTPQTHDGVAEHLDGDDAHRLFANLTLGDFRLEGVYGRRHKDVPTATYGTAFDTPGYWTTDTRDWLDLAYRHSFASHLELSGRLYYDEYEYEGSYPYIYNTGDPVTINRDQNNGAWTGAELSAHRTLFGPDEFVVGGEWRENLRQDTRNWDIAPYYQYWSDTHHSSVWALYAEDAFNLAPRLRLSAGLRRDAYTNFGGSTHPRVGLIWSVLDRTAFKLIYGSAFRVPTSYEVYLWGSGESANRALRPETFRTGEAVFESYFAEHYHASASWFVYRGDDYIQESVIDGIDAFRNSGDLHGNGIEIELAGRWHEAELRLGGAHQTVRFYPGNVRLSNSPADIAQASGNMPLVPGRLWASADLRTIGRRLNPFAEEVPGFTIADANLIARPGGSAWQLTLGVRNLFNLKYGDVVGPEVNMTSVPQDGRTFRARLDVRF